MYNLHLSLNVFLMPRHDIRDGTVLTAVNNEMLSRTPNMPHPKLLTSLGNSSPKDNEINRGSKIKH